MQHEVVSEPIDVNAVIARVASSKAGAIATFHGVVRDNSLGRKVRYLEYEAYPPMAIAEMERKESTSPPVTTELAGRQQASEMSFREMVSTDCLSLVLREIVSRVIT